MAEIIHIGPQPGPQTDFLSSPADIVIYGGAAGGGKSYGLLLEVLRHFDVPTFGAVIFRRNTTQIRNEGALWDQSKRVYGVIGARPKEATLEWIFPKGGSVKFAHLEHDNTVLEWQGSEIPLICFDELTHFTENQFWYMFSRNRSTCGVRPYIRATCNPDPDSFVRKLIDWWIDKDGWPIQSRSGVLRWFVRINDEIKWAGSREALTKRYGADCLPKSLTFIPAKLEDNKLLMKRDPGYKANLMALKKVDRERLLKGNWNIRATAGSFFRREWFPLVEEVPAGWVDVGRGWDRAASEPNETRPDPDWTRGVKLYIYADGKVCVGDMKSIQGSPGKVEALIKTVAEHDGLSVKIRGYQDPGSAGVKEAEDFMRLLAGYDVTAEPVSKVKAVRARPVSRQAEYGNVMVVRGEWNEDFFRELENFSEDDSEYDHDDIVDALSLVYNNLAGTPQSFDAGAIERYTRIMMGSG